MYTTIKFLGKRVIQTNPSVLTKGYSQTYICADYVWNNEEKYKTMLWGREFQRDALSKDMLILNKSIISLGHGSQRLFVELK